MKSKTILQSYLKKNKFYIGVFLFFYIFFYLLGIISLSLGLLIISLASGCLFYNVQIYDEIKKEDAIAITGCDSGLGYSIALHCKNNLGLHVIAGVHSTASRGAQELVKHGIETIEIELTNLESIESFTKSIQKLLESQKYRLRGFVNNAGMMIFGEFEWQTDEQIYNQLQVNLLGTARLTKSMIPILRQHKSRLIIVTSHCAIEALPGVAMYSATKAALSAWSTSLRVELKKSNITVVNFVPGSFIDSSNILFRQQNHFDVMDSSMQQEAKKFYQGYFKLYASYLTSFAQDNSLKKIQQPEIYDSFNDLLLDKNPNAIYICEPWRYWIYFTLCKISPTTVRDYLIEKFVQMPKFNY
ncbi:D-beta-hydroxybutyrate dehydrogenase, mitochondrial-like [Aphidius gifuensis]|uniref:D-beta-hydroxybutyrate dehydrogenase, mitochondrial-like n=1 Tax=Aphidius gifuensis TaxID=684658 RepID=UPI001CDBA9AC|nr:D-beta-hydroxybutyrate dehydrogenase, mitochondrial-like [Aphidius gifuensis]